MRQFIYPWINEHISYMVVISLLVLISYWFDDLREQQRVAGISRSKNPMVSGNIMTLDWNTLVSSINPIQIYPAIEMIIKNEEGVTLK